MAVCVSLVVRVTSENDTDIKCTEVLFKVAHTSIVYNVSISEG